MLSESSEMLFSNTKDALYVEILFRENFVPESNSTSLFTASANLLASSCEISRQTLLGTHERFSPASRQAPRADGGAGPSPHGARPRPVATRTHTIQHRLDCWNRLMYEREVHPEPAWPGFSGKVLDNIDIYAYSCKNEKMNP